MKATVQVTLKEDVPDAHGRVAAERLVDLGFGEVKSVRIGRLIEVEMDSADRNNAAARLEQMCKSLLVNGVIEDYTIKSME